MSSMNYPLQIEWMCRDKDDKPVSNFYPKVLSKIDVKYDDGIEVRVRVKLCFGNNVSEEIVISRQDIGKTDWDALDIRCILKPEYRRAKEYLWNIVRVELALVPQETVYHVAGLGIQKIDDIIVFLAGDHLIVPTVDSGIKTKIELAKSSFRLDIDLSLTKKEIFEGMWEVIDLSYEIGRVVVAHVISGFVKKAFTDVGFNPCTVLMIIGKSGLLKSTFVPFLTQLYNRADGIKAETRFNSSVRFIEDILCEYKECTAVVDDLHTAESSVIKKKNGDTAEEIIRRISDNTGRGHKEGSISIQKNFEGNVVFIGEYLVGRESTIPRTLVVDLTTPPDGKILDIYYRHKPLLISTFYYYFLQWYVDNFYEIREAIDYMLTKYREEITDIEIHGRLRDTLFYLRTSYMFFLEFCKDSGFISTGDALDGYSIFNSHILRLIQEQQERYRANKTKSENFDYLKLIQRLYKDKKFRVANSADTFNPAKHDGLIYYSCLCIRRKNLEKLIHKSLPDVSIDDVIHFLRDRQALKLYKGNKYTVKISTLNNKIGAIRFYAIKLEVLE